MTDDNGVTLEDGPLKKTLSTDISAGNGPDITYLRWNAGGQLYVEKGILTDIK